MAFNSETDRTNAAALIPEDAANTIIKDATKASAALSLFRTTTMSRKQQRIPALAAFPTAAFRDGDTGLAQTSEVAWGNKYLNAEEIDVIVPVPLTVLEDADFDIWGEVTPLCSEAIGRAIDAAIFFGTGAPTSWGDSLTALSATAGNVITYGTANAAAGGVAGDINAAMALVESDGYDINGIVAPRTLKGTLRGLRDSTGQKLLDVQSSGGQYTVEGEPVIFAMDGQWTAAATAAAARLFVGDWKQQMIAVRRDITYKVLTEGVITDSDGKVIFNLPQQGMAALMLTARVAWVMANPITHSNSSTPCPVATVRTAP